MLSMSFKGVRGLPHSPDGSFPGEEKGMWFIQVQHGAQRIRRDLPERLSEKHQRDSVGVIDGGPQWDEEVEIFDKEGQEAVEISLVFEGEPAGWAPRFGWSNKRRRSRHANATVEMRSFRSRPEESVTAWLPLRSISPDHDEDSGAVQVKFTYSDDCMAQGYLFTLFCGLVPLPLAEFWTGGTPAARENLAIEKDDTTPDHQQPSTPPPPPLTHAEPLVAPVGEQLPSTGAELPQLVSRIAVSPQESSRKVSFGPVSERVFQDYVEAGAA